MSTIELKNELISKIQVTENDDILGSLLELLEFELNDTKIYTLNKLQKESIAISKQQIIDGEVLTEEEESKLMDEWLNEYNGLDKPRMRSSKFLSIGERGISRMIII
jgi:hypothetical protein